MAVLILLSAFWCSVLSQPCEDYSCDSAVVRAILDSNGRSGFFVNSVSDSSNGRITSLTLYHLGNTRILQEVGNLTSLVNLDLARNSLINIPSSICSLKLLKFLNLEENQIQSVPEGIGGLTGLELLNLYANEIQYLPDSLGRLSSLRELEVNYNRILSLPLTIGGLESLRVFRCNHNSISAVPDGFSNLKSLEYADLSDNLIARLPEGLDSLQKLRQFKIYGNKLEYLPEGIGGMSSLVVLDVSNNMLSELPPVIANLDSLSYLAANNNVIAFLPESMVRMKNLWTLKIQDNPLNLCFVSDSFRNYLYRFPGLYETLHNCTPSGEEYVQDYNAVRHLLDTNALGRVSVERVTKSSGTRVVVLDLRGFSALTIPDTVCNLTGLRYLHADSCGLAELSPGIGSLPFLSTLTLANNKLNTIPAKLCGLPSLKGLVLENNALNNLPIEITGMKVTNVKIGNNNLCDIDDTIRHWLDGHTYSKDTLYTYGCYYGFCIWNRVPWYATQQCTSIFVEKQWENSGGEPGLNVKPNPFNPIAIIEHNMAQSGRGNICIYGVSGRKVFAKTIFGRGTVEWNAEGLASGIYLLKANMDGKSYSRKLVLQR